MLSLLLTLLLTLLAIPVIYTWFDDASFAFRDHLVVGLALTASYALYQHKLIPVRSLRPSFLPPRDLTGDPPPPPPAE
jgi:hypothetical protein